LTSASFSLKTGLRCSGVVEVGQGNGNSLDPEALILSAILLDQSILGSLELAPRHFLDHRHRTVFQAMVALSEQAALIDPVTVVEELRRKGHLDRVGGPVYVAELTSLAASSAGAPSHARIARERTAKKRAGDALASLKAALEAGATIAQVAGDVLEVLEELQADSGLPRRRIIELPPFTMESSCLEQLEPRVSYLGGGLCPAASITLLIGGPGSGKTFVAGQQACSVAMGISWFGIPTVRAKVGMLQLENDKLDLQPRLMTMRDALLAKYPAEEVREALESIEIVTPDILKLSRLNLLINDNYQQLAEWLVKHGIQLLQCDSFERLHSGAENEDLPYLVAKLDQLGRETGAALEVLHHERKPMQAKAKGGETRMDDVNALRGSTVLAATAKVIMRLVDIPGTNRRILRWGKVNFGKMPDPIYLEQEESGLFQVVDPPKSKSQEEKEENEAWAKQVIEATEERGISAEDGAKIMGCSPKSFVRYAKAVGAYKTAGEKGTKSNRWSTKTVIKEGEWNPHLRLRDSGH
jgi:AAA domain-containing protein/DnaB helicase-like protein